MIGTAELSCRQMNVSTMATATAKLKLFIIKMLIYDDLDEFFEYFKFSLLMTECMKCADIFIHTGATVTLLQKFLNCLNVVFSTV